jgi:hypothetical protein
MEQGLLLDRVNSYRRDLSIVKHTKDAVVISTYPTNARFARANNTTPLANIAAHPRPRKPVIKQRLSH